MQKVQLSELPLDDEDPSELSEDVSPELSSFSAGFGQQILQTCVNSVSDGLSSYSADSLKIFSRAIQQPPFALCNAVSYSFYL